MKGPCAKIGVRPAYVALITAVIALLSIVLGIAARFLSTFISIIIPAYKSIQAIESNGIHFYLLLRLKWWQIMVDLLDPIFNHYISW